MVSCVAYSGSRAMRERQLESEHRSAATLDSTVMTLELVWPN
jgi:hypothetical protein